ncbi:MAG: peptide deformylase [Bacteroidales bacterium]|nr:peptide deformylase [Bacteroidales bacterium]
MVAPIILYGSPVLRKHSMELVEEDNVSEITKMLFDTLEKSEGIGLSGPQLSRLKRIFVIDTSPLLEDDITIERFKDVFINPLIIDRSTENEIYKEGCLSLPGIFEDVIRPKKILVRYHDMSFNIIEKELDGIKARIFQHEFDHLEGILFIDKINPLKLKLLYGKLNKIKKVAQKQHFFNTLT